MADIRSESPADFIGMRSCRRAILWARPGAGASKWAVSRRFVAPSAGRMREWMASDLSQLHLLGPVQIEARISERLGNRVA